MTPTWIYGIVKDNVFYSNTMKKVLPSTIFPDGLFCLDIAASIPTDTIRAANMGEFDEAVKKSKYMFYVNGYAFKDKFIPDNVMKWKKYTIPISICNSLAEDWDYIRVLYLDKFNIFMYMCNLLNQRTMDLFDLSKNFADNKNLTTLKNITPEMRMLYTFHGIERLSQLKEQQRLVEFEKLKTVEGRLKHVIEQSGGTLVKYTDVRGIGFQVLWKAFGETIETVIDKDFKVIEAGFCVSGYDRTQSMSSVVKLLNDYKDQNDRIVKTRSTR